MINAQEEIAQLREEVANMHQDFAAQSVRMTQVQDDIRDLVRAWNAATQLLVFVKWAASIVTAMGILWTAITHVGQR